LTEGVVKKTVIAADSDSGVLQIPVIHRVVNPPPEPEPPEPDGLLGKPAKWLG
jgi:hypothetical protein